MKKIFETERLWFRELTGDDAEEMYLLNADPEVVRYTGDAPYKCIEEARQFYSNYKPYQQYGCGRWATILKETHEVLGWCGLKYDPKKDEVDLGYRFHKKHWGKGYATESSIGSLRYGFDVLKYEVIVARAMHGNLASIKVMQKLGMKYLEDFDFDGHSGVCYEIYKKDFKF